MVRMNKEDFKKVMALALALGIVIGIGIGVLVSAIGNNKTSYEPLAWKEIRVSTGDTLWGICEEEYGNVKYDFRRVIDIIEEHNNIKTCLQPGYIEVPIFTEYEAGYQAAIEEAEIINEYTISFNGDSHWYK